MRYACAAFAGVVSDNEAEGEVGTGSGDGGGSGGADCVSPSAFASAAASPASAAAGAGERGSPRSLVRRAGLATSYMEDVLCAPFLAPAAAAPAAPALPVVRIVLRPARDFAPPVSLQAPLVMIGPGTGVSPFVGFLQHRAARAARLQDEAQAVCSGAWRPGCEVRGLGRAEAAAASALGEAVLFFGNRRRGEDFLYEHELSAHLASGALARLHCAWSREESGGADSRGKVYVQTRLREQGAAVCALLARGAHVFVCGDGMKMAKDVHAALVEVLVAHGAAAGLGVATAAEAEALLARLAKESRYSKDVWG